MPKLKIIVPRLCFINISIIKAISKRNKEDQTHQGILKDKKDIESWLHQADPSLTVRELPEQPQISFRKNSHFSATNNGAEVDKNVRVMVIYFNAWLIVVVVK